LVISSGGKTFNTTGWKIGWVCASEPLVTAVRTVKQFLTYVNGAPFQYAVAEALDRGDELVDPLVAQLRQGRDLLMEGLSATGMMNLSQPDFKPVDIRPVQPDGDAWLSAALCPGDAALWQFPTRFSTPIGTRDGTWFGSRSASDPRCSTKPPSVSPNWPPAEPRLSHRG
jgi:N-succinyldiaminopimelate aminotransferase